ncbi:hypothetical protein L6164_017914 [Bauhinia variegata]|uniref:Uncharacterized protein n=1 Tax=Bauhinia variegata TaxID=167791 RepID=A0ACB9NCY6_BAUVA|nr:hypothetical protein L6164_017914 [Bauhinia variegata]
MLQELQIQRCPKLISTLPENLPCLDRLVISACQVLEDSLPWVPRLRELELTGCDSFKSLPGKMIQGNTCLQTVAIRNCSSLVTIPEGGLSSTLRSLDIYECRNLKLFPHQHLQGQHHCISLERLHLKYCCNSLISFPLSFFTKLEDLRLQDCNNLQVISNAPESLPYLRKLKLKECSKLVLFPEGGLPTPMLESLSISRCANISPYATWGLEMMASLASLSISGLTGFTSLEHTGIQCLSSLKILKIKDCKTLESLPLEALATSLSHLTIRACPLLQQRCKRDSGDYWNLISCIPSIVIED